MAAIKHCKKCGTEINPENAFVYERRRGVGLIRNTCKKCFITDKKLRSGSRRVTSKVCPSCMKGKLSSFYGKDATRADGISYLCKECKKRKGYVNRIKRLYGMTEDDYESAATRQNKKCLCCLRVETLVVDHDHKTGEARGLLCSKCNMVLGLVDESIMTLKRMISYVGG